MGIEICNIHGELSCVIKPNVCFTNIYIKEFSVNSFSIKT